MSPSTDNPFLALTAAVKADLDPALNALLDVEVADVGQVGREVAGMLRAAQALLCRGGKRLRAGLLVAAHHAVTGDSSKPLPPPVLQAALALELLQAYFLIHDDWMDKDATRRGGPTVHAALTHQFQDEHLGACSAVLAGDYMMTLAAREFHIALETGTPGDEPQALHLKSKQLLRAFTSMQLAAVAGQQLDVVGLTRDSLKVYELKTSSYTVCGPLLVGALLAGAQPSMLRHLEAFAQPLGIAFQLRDDLLGVFADPTLTGKPFGRDIAAGKWTWLAQWVEQHAAPVHQNAWKAAFGKEHASVEQLRQAVGALESSGARAAAETYIGSLKRTATEALQAMALAPAAHTLLTGAITALVDRGH